MFQGMPRWLVVFGVAAILIVEIASRLPDLMLLPQKLAGTAGEYGAKALQPDLVATQIGKTDADTRVSNTQARLNTEQAAKTAAETKVAELQQQVTQLQGILLASQATQAQSQARLADTQAAKTVAETQVAQLQQALTAAQTTRETAQAQQAQAEATKTNLQNAGTMVAWAALIGGGLYAADKAGLIPHNQGTSQANTQTTSYTQPTQSTSAPFETGRTDWHRWHDWEATLTGNRLAGVQYWAGVRSQKPAPLCANAPGGSSSEFQETCEAAKKFLTAVDQARASNAEYRAGWNQGAKETGGF